MESIDLNRQVGIVAAFTLLSWLGEVIHNAFELPQLTLLSPENSVPGIVSLILFLAWWLLPFKRAGGALLLTWATLHLAGCAIVTIIPFPFLPFYPAQNLGHYAAHLAYGLAQLPLMAVMISQLRALR